MLNWDAFLGFGLLSKLTDPGNPVPPLQKRERYLYVYIYIHIYNAQRACAARYPT